MPVWDTPAGTPAEYAACRAANHWLESVPVPAGTTAHRGAVVVWWRCMRCGTERHDELHGVTLEVVGRRYLYPDGYLMAKDDGAPSRAAWRATYLRALGVISDRQATEARRYRKQLWETDEP